MNSDPIKLAALLIAWLASGKYAMDAEVRTGQVFWLHLGVFIISSLAVLNILKPSMIKSFGLSQSVLDILVAAAAAGYALYLYQIKGLANVSNFEIGALIGLASTAVISYFY